MSSPTPIRFAIIALRPLDSWQRASVQQLLALDEVKAVAVIAPEPGAGALLAGVPVIAMTDANALSGIQSLDLDFILSWEPNTFALSTSARHGEWRYQFGDWVNYRGGEPGFWEVLDGAVVSAVMLVRVQSDPHAVIVLRDGYLRTQLLSAAKNRRQLQERGTHFAAAVCVDIRNGVTSRLTAPPLKSTAPSRITASRLDRAIQTLRIIFRMARTALRDLFRHEQWNIGVVEQPIDAFLSETTRAATRWWPAPRTDEIRADPFGTWQDGELTVLCEYLNFHDHRGIIVAVAAGKADTRVDIGPSPPVHLSYPYLFEQDGRTWCIPETHEAAEIALYELNRLPDRWKKVATLVSGTVTVDASLFRHGGWWWLSGSDAAPKGANSELRLWFAPDLHGPWLPHPGNPVKIDVRSARPGGTPFLVDGVLYRPAQDCSTTYGRRIVINRVTTLTPTTFREEFAAAVEPQVLGPYPNGLHTLSAAGPVTLIDGKRICFVPAQFWRTLRSWLRIRGAAHG